MHAIATKTFQYFKGKRERDFLMIYIALIVISVHWTLIAYINSSYLGQFFSATPISILYGIGAIASLIAFFFMPRLLQKIGNFKLIIWCSIFEMCALLGMAFIHSAWFSAFFFVAHDMLISLILFNIDIFIEEIIGTQETQTGSRRGLYLAFASIASAIAPPIAGSLLEIGHGAFGYVYVASALCIIPFIAIIIMNFRKFYDPVYIGLSLKKMAHVFKTQSDIRNILLVSFHLQLFFTWTLIYVPLYLSLVAHFTWVEIGLIIFVALTAYVLFEYPIGIIADKYIGEKEMMAFGFLLLTVVVSWFAFIPHAGIGVWMVAMFLSRVGASFIEATSESYFFKHVQSTDSHTISMFRMTRPLSTLVGAALGGLVLFYFPFNFVFIALAIMLIPGFFFTMYIHDTR